MRPLSLALATLRLPGRLLRIAGDVASLQPARVRGASMKPMLRDGDLIAIRRLHDDEPRPGQVVLATVGYLDVVKRVADVEGSSVRLVGDNRRASTDPGVVDRSQVTGVVVARYWPLRASP